MRKKKWVKPFLESESKYLLADYSKIDYSKDIYVEIGMGMGDFICDSCIQNPNILYIGLEKDETCVARSIKKATDLNINNLFVILEDASNLLEIFKEKSIKRIYLHFSDPWPKKRTHKRRLTYYSFLQMYQKILRDDGDIIFKTDNREFFDDSIIYFKEANFVLDKIDYDYHSVTRNEPKTAYEQKFIEQNKPINFAHIHL